MRNVYLHFDLDVLDPSEVVWNQWAPPHGLTVQAVIEQVRGLSPRAAGSLRTIPTRTPADGGPRGGGHSRGGAQPANERMAAPAPRRLASFISEYFRESRTPSAPARKAAITASRVLSGVDLLLFAAVGMSMSMPGQSCVFVPFQGLRGRAWLRGKRSRTRGRSSSCRQLLLVLVIQHAVVEIEQFLAGHIAVDGPSDAADVARHALAAAVVVHHHLQKVRVLGELARGPARRDRSG